MEEIDEAFHWLVLILSTLTGALIGSIHLYPLSFSSLTPTIEIGFMKLLFVPLIVLVISWLSSHLFLNKEVKIILKSFSWIYALLILLTDLTFFLNVILQYDIAGLMFPVSIWVPIIVYMTSIRRQYRLIFPDSKFLKSIKIQVLFCIIIFVITVVQMLFSARSLAP